MTFKEFFKVQRKKLMPCGENLAEQAQKNFQIDRRRIKEKFNLYLRGLLNLEYEIYKRYEKNCSFKIIGEAIKQKLLKESKSFLKTFKANYDNLLEFFISISNSRKARAGGSFEKHVRYLFELLDYPFERQKILNGKVDYIISSISAFRKNRTACVVISIKRTLRERWRQVVGELASTRAGKIYLLTADEEITHKTVEEISKHNVILVVWDEWKEAKFKDVYSVIGFSQFINVDLPSTRKMWELLI